MLKDNFIANKRRLPKIGSRVFWDFNGCELSFQLEIHASKWRKLYGKAPLTVLPRNVLCPDFAEVPDVAAAEQTRIGVEDFFPGSASGGAQAVIVADNWREVEYAQNHIAMVVFTYKADDGVVCIIAPDPFEAGVVMVDFPERCVVLVDVVQFLHHG